jgi:hypothetical protein
MVMVAASVDDAINPNAARGLRPDLLVMSASFLLTMIQEICSIWNAQTPRLQQTRFGDNACSGWLGGQYLCNRGIVVSWKPAQTWSAMCSL